MERRKFVNAAMLIGSATALQACMGGGLPGGLPMTGGGGDGASWTDIIKTAKSTMASAASAAMKATNAMQEMGQAIGFKQEAAITASTIKKIEDGDYGDLADVTAASEAYQADLVKAMKDKKSWTADEKKAFSKGVTNYAFAMVDVGQGIVGLITLINQIKGAAQPGLQDIEAIKIAKDIPPLFKVAKANGPNVLKFWGTCIDYCKTNDIAIPKDAMAAADGAAGDLNFG